MTSLQPRPKLLRSNPTRLGLYYSDNPNWPEYNDDAILVGYTGYRLLSNRNELEGDLNEDLSDSVKLRLFLARQLALRKYDEKWG